METLELILKILLVLYILQSLLKFGVHFLVKYETRRKRIAATYERDAVPVFDNVLLVLMLVFVALLFASGQMAHLSFTTGLVVGLTLLQIYFHRFSEPVSQDKMPDDPVTPIKLMSFGIQANPRRAWREYLFIAVLLVWGLYMIVTSGSLPA